MEIGVTGMVGGIEVGIIKFENFRDARLRLRDVSENFKFSFCMLACRPVSFAICRLEQKHEFFSPSNLFDSLSLVFG